ncbi:Gly-Xaa carboxypeptidase [Kluyveromyces lactis]|uniref:KLLA0A06512p n=1 Tax=Kluyveromyces lactis (strain ATCC 8585 / CBS 2359 / DSM 70799 / NBRC 1267 / NRRL Y-1140 / WM37) TaxID=284590 RepID=Q6CXP9_KLULA|nr:uncharacterized protein KLLA0_A06512g [Kluyveromyces lactis]CAH02878.1 KLLA0A06512p [Kluyveromyces lactis]|eukprot:XP_451290.1 uncharacterized protein KLLA0_A06512g [Kluyveromyces lactis]
MADEKRDKQPVKGSSSKTLVLLLASLFLAGFGYLLHNQNYDIEQVKSLVDQHFSNTFGTSIGKLVVEEENDDDEIDFDSVCLKTEPISPSGESSIEKILNDAEYKKLAIEKLSGALQIPTEIQDVNPRPKDNIEYYSEFFKFHKYLEEQYPLVHKHLKKELVNEVGLVYTWAGSNADLKPVMFTAHQDVVPVNRDTWGAWKFPPFSGHYDEKTDTIWGRGAIDCKNLLLGELAAIEHLLSEGFVPERGVVLSYGFDEESSGVLGAKYLSEFLHDRYGDNGIYALVDEGNTVLPLSGNVFVAAPVTAEKGYVDLKITVHGHGGHSSMPADHTTIGIASDLITLLEANPFPYHLTEDNPVYGFLTCAAKHDTRIPPKIKKAIVEAPKSEKQKNLVFRWLNVVKPLRDLFRTSQAVDIINGGIKANALPEVTSFLVNHRIDVTSSVKQTIDKDLAHADQVAKKYNLGLVRDGEVLIEKTKDGYIEIVSEKSLEPAPSSPTKNSSVWDLFTGTIQDVFGTHILSKKNADLFVTTSMTTGNTDTKYYWALTKNIYRFFPMIVDPKVISIIHSVNEHVEVSNHLSIIAFFYEYILNINEYASNDV